MPTTEPAAPLVATAHHLAARTRLRVGRHALGEAEAAALASALAAVPSVNEVCVNRQAASVLCLHQPDVDLARLVEVARAALDGLAPPRSGEEATEEARAPSGVAREVARLFRKVDSGVREATGGKLDLGTVTTLGFIGAGAIEVAVKQRLPAPPWFNLAWWGIRTFLTFEGEAIRAARSR